MESRIAPFGRALPDCSGAGTPYPPLAQYMPVFLTLLTAVCFGVNMPFAKFLLGNIVPISLAPLLYLGYGKGLAFYRGLSRVCRRAARQKAPLARCDVPWLLERAKRLFTSQ